MQDPSLLTRSTLQTIAGKAIRDLKYGGEAGNAQCYRIMQGICQPTVSAGFLEYHKSYATASDSQYDPLIHRMAASVREESLQTLAVNLCCGAFSTGAEILRNHPENQSACWIQKLDATAEPDKEILHDGFRQVAWSGSMIRQRIWMQI